MTDPTNWWAEYFDQFPLEKKPVDYYDFEEGE